MNHGPRNKLFVMMILEFFIWGAWLPLIWGYMGTAVADGGLGFSATQQAWIGSGFAIDPAAIPKLQSLTKNRFRFTEGKILVDLPKQPPNTPTRVSIEAAMPMVKALLEAL